MEENKLNTQIAVSYARVSTNKEEQKESLIHQKEFFKEYVKRNNMILKEIYCRHNSQYQFTFKYITTVGNINNLYSQLL